MKKIYRSMLFCAIFVALTIKSFGQLPMVRTSFNVPFVPINSGAGGGTLGTSTGDDTYQNNVPIGFTFNYLGTGYSSMTTSSNGWASFNNLLTYDAANTNLCTSTNNLILAPWWDDLTTDSIVRKTTGAPGSQIFTLQWYSKGYWSGSTNLIRYQIKLYEGTNVIEFHYGNMIVGAGSVSESASIGIKGATGGNGDFIDAVTGSGYIYNGFLSTTAKWPTRYFRFTPGAATPVAGGTYNVGAGQIYPTIDEAIADVNHRGVSGPVVLSLTQSLYDITPANGDNIFPVFFGPIQGSSATNSILIQPATGTSSISYNGESSGGSAGYSANTSAYSTSNEPIIGIVGSNNVNIRNLVLTCSQPSGNSIDRGVGIINQSPALGTSSCSVKNTTVTLNRSNTSSIAFETRTSVTPTVAGGANSNNTLMDISISNVYSGILLSGNASFPDLSNMITTSTPTNYNSIGSAAANDIGNGSSTCYGIQAFNQGSVTINNNQIQNLTVTGSVLLDGIFLNVLQGTSSVFNNKLFNIKSTGAASTSNITGIRANIATTGTHQIRVYNNFVSGLTSGYTGAASALRQLKGIYVQSAGGGVNTTTINVDFNNVSVDGSANPNISSTCYEIGTAVGPIINTRNNIFANFTGAQTAPAQHLTWFSTSATAVGNVGSVSNYNDLFVLNPTQGFIGMGAATIYTTLPNWQAGMTQDANSINCAPGYVNNANDLHAGGLCINSAGNNAGIPWVTTDIDNTPRTGPDIGADEIDVCVSVSGGTTTPGSYSICAGQGVNLINTGATAGGGISYQWQSAPAFNGPYTDIPGATGTSYNTGTLSPNTYFYQLLTTCGPSSITATSNTITVLVNPLPSVSVTPSAATICVPGGTAVALNASGANTYTWGPAAGLSGTVGANVSALPAASTIYTVTGTDVNGCVSTSSTSITISEVPSVVLLTASPTLVCSGGSSSLTAMGALTNTYSVTNIPYAPIPTPSVGVTTLCSAGVAVTPLSSGSLDDGGWANLAIPFNFNYFSSGYSSFAVSTNGFIFLGGGLPGTFSGYGNTFPSVFAAMPSIGAVYSDLNWSTVGTIQTFTTGSAPNRMVVVNWTGGQFYLASGSITAQAIIYETSNIIDVHIFQSTGNNVAVEGIQDAPGANAIVVPGRNAVSWTVVTPDAYRWSPNGGAVTFSWTPATYLNFNNISNPVANTVTSSIIYTVAMTATNGCVNSPTLNLAADITPTVTITGTNTICSSNTLNLTANGAVTYSWSTGAVTNTIAQTPSVTTTYSVIGYSLFGCTGTDVKTVTVNTTPTVNVAGTSTSCAGSMINLIASGANTYSWSNGSTLSVIAPFPTVSTTYTVVGTSTAGCPSSPAIKSVTVYALPTATITASPQGTICKGETAQLIASAFGTDTYSWSNGPTSPIISVSPSVSTVYTLTVGNNLTGCNNTTTLNLIVSLCTGLQNQSLALSGLSLYPNPNTGEFTVELNNGLPKSIVITDVTGRIVLESSSLSDKTNIDIKAFANGIYYAKIQSNSATEVFKIVKQ